MKLRIEIELDGEAFDTRAKCRREVDRILADLRQRMPLDREDCVTLRDINGNKVGKAEVTE